MTGQEISKNNNDKGYNYNMKKNDLYLTGIILLAALAITTGYLLFFREDGANAQITVNGEVYRTIPLDQDTTLTIPSDGGHTNILTIHDGYADITDADCPDRLCVHQKKISKKGETLVCLPHKVVISIISGKQSQTDGVAY